MSKNNKTIELSRSVKLPRLTIKNNFNFGIHLNNARKVAGEKIKGLGRIKNRSNLSQVKILYNPFILSQFSYFEEKFMLFYVVSVGGIVLSMHY